MTGVTGNVSPVARKAAGSRDTMSNWYPSRIDRWREERDRQLIDLRAEDLVASDPHAASLVDSITLNTVGVGLTPQSRVEANRLGLSVEEARAYQASAERAWRIWCREADAGGRMNFGAMQYLAVRSMLEHGEFLFLPLMLKPQQYPNRTFSLALQDVHPARLGTPSDKTTDRTLRAGVSLGPCREPVGYWIANPQDGLLTSALPSWQYGYYPAWRGHRPQVLHRFYTREPEQVRGESVLTPVMKTLRDLSDYLDYELVANVITSMFPLFIETSDPGGIAGAMADPGSPGETDSRALYHSYEAGQVLYGDINQKPHLLAANRPGGTFGVFVERLLRAAGAGPGVPLEIFTKDFSKTNYSSARAALLEAWRLFRLYRFWLRDSTCQLLWELVLEEAWLKSMLELPASAPDFYDARADYCRSEWLGPPRGHVDPVKEMEADIAGLEAGVLTLADVIAERGGDWESVIDQRAREKEALEAAGLTSDVQAAGARLAAVRTEPETAPDTREDNPE